MQPQPIPSKVQSVASRASGLSPEKAGLEKKDDTDSITEEIAEVRTPEVAKKHSEWVRYLLLNKNIIIYFVVLVLPVFYNIIKNIS